MRTPASKLELFQPRSLTEALWLLGDRTPAVAMAGCTDLMVALGNGAAPGTRYVNLWGLEPLRRIAMKGQVLSVGALATYTDIIASPEVCARLPILVDAARQVGAAQIQNRGTLGGNIANASPAGDTLPVLAVADAVIVLKSLDGTRRVPFASFYTGYRRTRMRPDELIVAVEIPPIEGRQWFRKVGTRAAQAISKVVMAAIRSPRPRIALGSVAPTVVRARHAEDALARGASIADAQLALLDDIAPIDDLRSTAAYRRQVSMNLLARFWQDTADGLPGLIAAGT